jgi:hypothetical protein
MLLVFGLLLRRAMAETGHVTRWRFAARVLR